MRLSVPIYHLKQRAKLLARETNIPLHQALDRIARQEGFSSWSLLAAKVARSPGRVSMLPVLDNGDLVLIAGRPGQGKTLLALQLLIDAAQAARRSLLFTLDLSRKEAEKLIRTLNPAADLPLIEIETSDAICADYVIAHLADARPGDLAVIDYLQILDQDRQKPPVFSQMEVLAEFAGRKGVILAFISQVDRNFDSGPADVPALHDIRLPNPIPAGIFSKTCMVQAGVARIGEA